MALSPCELVPIDRELAAQAVSRDPELALSMMKYLARTVRLLSEQLDAMAFRPAEWRIARYLLSLSPSGGPVQCTQEDIAAAVSVSRVTGGRAAIRWRCNTGASCSGTPLPWSSCAGSEINIPVT